MEEIECKKISNEESGKINYVCPICLDDVEKNIEEIDYENQCSTRMHYMCDECKNGWKNNLFEQHKDYTCVVCKIVIKEYRNEQQITPFEEYMNRVNVNMERNVRNSTNDFFYKLLWFEFILLFTSVIILVNSKPSKKTVGILYVLNVFMGLMTFVAGMLSCRVREERIQPL